MFGPSDLSRLISESVRWDLQALTLTEDSAKPQHMHAKMASVSTISQESIGKRIDALWGNSGTKGDCTEEKSGEDKGWRPILAGIYGKVSDRSDERAGEAKNRRKVRSRSCVRRGAMTEGNSMAATAKKLGYRRQRKGTIIEEYWEKSRQQAMIRDQKALNPDEYFQTKICENMGIDMSWLQETDTRRRFRQNVIQRIHRSEKKSVRAAQIMRDFLATKRRDHLNLTTVEKDPKELEAWTRDEVFFHVYKLRSQILAQRGQIAAGPKDSKTDPGRARSQSRVDSRASPRKMSLAGHRTRTQTQTRTEYQRRLATTAEVIQKDISKLERTLEEERPRTRAEIAIRIKRKQSALRTANNQDLANSILARARARGYTAV